MLVATCVVLSAALPGGSFAAKPGGGGTGTTCTLVPQLTELSIGQGLPYPVLVRGKEILARAYLSRPQCSDSDDIIDITNATLTMTGAGATLANVGPTPAIVGTTYPQIAPFGSAPAQDAAGDPKFVIPASATVAAATADRYTASFRLRVDYRARTTASATPVANFVIFPLANQTPTTATIEKRTAALRVLVQPLGDPTQSYATWFTDLDRTTMQNAMTTLSRIFPVPDGTGDLAGTTGGVRYTINPTLLDIRSLLGSDGKWCGTQLNWTAIKAIMAQHLQSWNTANPSRTADVIVGAVSSTKSNGASGSCAEAMSIPGSPQMWVRSIPDANRAPSITGGLTVMEMSHYLGVVPETRDAFGDAFHSPYTAADGTNPNRGYNVFARSYLADDRSVMLLTGTGWNNSTTLLERDDFAAILCQLGGGTTADCGVSGTVGSTTGVGAGPRFVMSGRTDGTAAGTAVVESYFTNNVAPTQPDPESHFRLLQFQGSTLLTEQGVPVLFAESEHHNGTDTSPAGSGVFAISLPFNTAANRIQLVHHDEVLYERHSPGPPQITSTTRLQRGQIVNYTDDESRDDTDPAITNDGKWVAWEAQEGAGISVYIAPASDVGQAIQLGQPEEAIPSSDPAWCGNGTQLAYVDEGDIYRISVDTRGPGIDFGDPFLLYDADEVEPGGLPEAREPTWSPDCSRIAFEASSDIFVIDRGGTGLRALTTDNRSHNPSWSQTSGDNRIAYQRERFFSDGIALADYEIVLASHTGTDTQFTVTTAADENNPGQPCTGEPGCSLREAINAANGNAAGTRDSVHFTIPGTAPFIISPTSALPVISQPLVMDASTQPGWALGTPVVQLDGTAPGAGDDGLVITAGDSEIRGFVISGWTTPSVSGNAIVLRTSGDNLVAGNHIGLDIAGTAANANDSGIRVEADGNRIGGTTALDRNVISGSLSTGLAVVGSANVVSGNYIGTNVAGTAAVANVWGLIVSTAAGSGNVVGGSTAGARNVISGNSAVGIALDTDGNTIEGNYIGTDAAGTAAIPNSVGVELACCASGNRIGGTRNVVSGNAVAGIRFFGAGIDNVVTGNWIGLDVNGDPLPNELGVDLQDTSGALIGGTTGAGNVISGNTGFGISVLGGSANRIGDNRIGTDPSGLLDRGNGGGITILGSSDNIIGGAANTSNLISGNGLAIYLDGPGATSNVVEHNGIGVDLAGDPLGNDDAGIWLANGATGNRIGGDAVGNIIAHNSGDGVRVTGSTTVGNVISLNYIVSNTGMGIDLADNGVTANDSGDGDSGPNNLQNHPVLDAATVDGDSTDVTGSLNSQPDTGYTLEFFRSDACDTTTFGEGAEPLGETVVTTDASGNAPVSFATPVLAAVGDVITATARAADPDNSTSEFSPCRSVTAAPAETPSWVVNTTDDAVDAFGCGTIHCSLREAISRANSVAGTDTITFNIPGAAPHTIAPTTALPAVTGSVVMDATTQPGWAAGAPVIELNGASAPGGADALSFSANGNTVRGLAINSWPGDAIFFTVGGSQVVEGNFIGTTLDGTGDAGNGGIGVRIGSVAALSNSRIGGTTLATRNVISGNATGLMVFQANGVSVSGNYIGTNAAGTAAIPNQTGVRFITSPNGQIGGSAAGSGNVISGNTLYGIWIDAPGTGVGGTIVEGNLIGTGANGTNDLGNGVYGVHINRSGGNIIGGTAPGARNVISGGLRGVGIVDSGSGEATANVVHGNLIGVEADGSTALGNSEAGVYVSNAPGNAIGGTLDAANVIAANGIGVWISGIDGNDNVVEGNSIGVLADGVSPRGNTGAGVLIHDGAQQNIVRSNIIANNGGDGVQVADGVGVDSTGNEVRGNSIHSNVGLGIDLLAFGDPAAGGVTPNDAGDGDGGSGNDLMNFPAITSAQSDGAETLIEGALDSEASLADVRIDVYANPACDGSGNGEGAEHLDTAVITLDAAGHGTWSVTVEADRLGEFVTATATDLLANTSEFSACELVTAAPTELPSWTVNTTDDETDGFGCGSVHCSLREAIARANATPNSDGPDEISFDIPGTATPAAPHVIAVDSALPAITAAVIIDASTEPDFDAETQAPVVQLDGARLTGEDIYGLTLAAAGGDSTIRGLSVTNFEDAGIAIFSNGNGVFGNYIGLKPDGVTAGPNGSGSPGGYGVYVSQADSNLIGAGDGVEASRTNRNVISGNDGPGVAIFGGVAGAVSNSIENNYIGVNAAGSAAVGNDVSGVVISDTEQTSIGGVNVGTGNVVSGNVGDGITIIGGTGPNFVQRNFIGTNAAGTAALANDGDLPTDGRGILLANATEVTVGGVDGVSGASLGNLISGNATDGVEIQGSLSAANFLTGNRIGTNAGGTAAIPNSGAGIEILGGAGAHIGLEVAGGGNVISGNDGDGVAVVDGSVYQIVGNAIDANGGLGIDLVAEDDDSFGVTANDTNDADHGPNTLLNFPVIETASSDGETTTITGFLESVPPGDYELHFYASTTCDASGHGEGARFLGGVAISSDSDGDVPFTFPTNLASDGDEITATATDEDLNTSEFSACSAVVGQADLSITKSDDPDPVIAGEDLTYTISVSNPNGPDEATNVVVTDQLSPDVSFDPVGSDSRCSESDGTVTCTIESILPDSPSETVEIVVVPDRSGTVENTVSVAGDQFDPNLEDNTATAETEVLAADWEIWTVDPDDADDTRALLVSNGTQPSWGTDNQIAFARGGAIWVVSGQGTGATQVAGSGSLDSAPALGGRLLGFERTIPFASEGSQQDVMLVRGAEVITVTAQVDQPDNARFDIFFDCGGPFFPMAVGLPPDAITEDGTAKVAYTYDSTLSCGSGTPMITAVASDGVFRSDAGAEAAKTEVTSDDKDPVVAIYSPVDGETLLQYDVIAAHGWGKDPENGQLPDSQLSWMLTGPGGLSRTGNGHAVDFQPPAGGWTPSIVIGGIPADDYLITLTGTDSTGNSVGSTRTFAILADNDRDNLHAGIDKAGCSPTSASADNNAGNAFGDLDSDGVPNSDDRLTQGGVCSPQLAFSAVADFEPDTFNVPATGQFATILIRVPYKSVTQIDSGSVKITEIGGLPANIPIASKGWSVSGGVGVAKFDRMTLQQFFVSNGMVGHRVTIVVEGRSRGVTPQWTFKGIDSTNVIPAN